MARSARDLRRMENSEMNTNQLLDALTDHLALYHRRSQSASDTKASARSRVLEWLRTLSIEQRHTLFTVCDEHWVAVVLQMQKRLKKEGKGYFFLLTDVLECERASTSQDKLAASHSVPLHDPEQKKARKFHKARKKTAGQASLAASKPVTTGLPGLCFRKAKGLLARQDMEQAAGELLCQSLELSSSSDTTSMGLNALDTMTVSEDLVADMNQFVAIMDGITHGEFLSSISGRADSPWEELPWLKAMGYYTLPAFIANKLELLLWSAWLQADGSRRPPRNLAIELRKTGKGVKTSSIDVSTSSVHRRTRGFSEWWMSLREDLKLKALRFAVATAAKAEVQRASHNINAVSHDYAPRTSKVQESCLQTMYLSDTDFEHSDAQSVSDAGSVFSSHIAGIKALIELANSFSFIKNTCETGASEYPWLFHSSLYLADTLPEHVMRRARNALQMAMLESMEADLLRNEVVTNQANLKDSEGKVKKDNRRKKIRNSSQGKGQSNFGNEVVGKNSGLSLEGSVSNQQQQGEFTSQSICSEKKHEGSSKQAKKKKHSRAKSKAVKEAGPAIESKDDYRSNHEDIRKLECEFTSMSLMCTEMTEDLQKVEVSIAEEEDGSCFTKANSPKPIANECTVEKESFKRSLNLVDKCSQQFLSEEKVTGHFSNKQLTANRTSLEISCNSSTRVVCQNSETSDTAAEISKDEILRCTTSAPNASEEGTGSYSGRVIQDTSSTVNNSSTSHPVYNLPCASSVPLKPLTEGYNSGFHTSVSGLPSAHEWPGAFQLRVSMGRSQMMPPATERLHLDVGRNWQQRLQASFVALRTPVMLQPPSGSGSISKGSNSVSSNFVGLDCSAVYPAGYNLPQKRGCSLGFREEAGYMALPQPAFPSPFLGLGTNTIARAPEEFKHDDRTPEDTDYDDPNYFSGDFDDPEGHLISEEEGERQFLDLNLQGEGDYNQYFGGGVMFWNTADYSGTGYSRPPSLSSEDSSWARHEADFSVVLDDIMGLSGAFPNVASPNMVSTSPPAASYSPGFEQTAVSTLPRANLSVTGNDFSGKFPPLPPNVLSAKSDDEQMKCPKSVGTLGVIEGHTADFLTRPGLRPIIVVRDNGVNRQMPTSEFVRHQEARSPHIPRKLEVPRQRRPPSPVLRCVPPAPPPPPPSPVSGISKRKGLTTVRSGSSSPRRWGLGSAYHKDEQDISLIIPEARDTATNFFRSRSWADKSPMHPISGALLRERLFAIPAMALEQDHPDIALPMQTTALYKSNPSLKSAISRLHTVLHEEIESFCKQVAAENLLRKPYITVAVDKVVHAMQVLWPRSRLKIFGSNATGLALPCSDVDLVVCLPPVRNLEPIKEAGILEGRNGIKETCLQHAARYLADQDWVKGDTLKTIENTAIPIIMLVAHVPPHVCSTTHDDHGPYDSKQHLEEESANEKKTGPWGGKMDREFVRLDISFEASSHTGLRTAELVRELTGQFPAIVPLALILKQFLTDRSLDHPYTGGLSSYCLVLLITRFLQHQHHLGWPYQQNLGSLLMDFLHFFGCVFDPRRMGVRIRGGGMYVNRDRGHSIDPLHIEDPLCPSNNVGRNCFRILQCVKAFADAYSYIEKTLVEIADTSQSEGSLKILSNILPSVASLESLSEMSA